MTRQPLRFLLFGLFLVGGCSGGAKDPGPLTFSQTPAIPLAVQGVEIEQPPTPAPAGNFIDKQRTDALLAATRDMLRARFRPAGGADWGKVTIEEASLIERPREKMGGVAGAFTREPASSIDGKLAVRVGIVDGLGLEKAYARAVVQRSRPVLEGTKVIDRDTIARALIKDLLDDLSRSLESSVEENLAAFRAAS